MGLRNEVNDCTSRNEVNDSAPQEMKSVTLHLKKWSQWLCTSRNEVNDSAPQEMKSMTLHLKKWSQWLCTLRNEVNDSAPREMKSMTLHLEKWSQWLCTSRSEDHSWNTAAYFESQIVVPSAVCSFQYVAIMANFVFTMMRLDAPESVEVLYC
jgi:hypothetical protein